jgi:hypothetical protein
MYSSRQCLTKSTIATSEAMDTTPPSKAVNTLKGDMV